MLKKLLCTAAVASLLAGPAMAQSTSPSTGSGSSATTPSTMDNSGNAASGASSGSTGTMATAPSPSTGSADAIIGTNIKNPEGDSIGKIDDVTVSSDGKVDKVIVSVGGFLGMGSKKVALNWNDLKLNPSDDTATVSMTKDQLKAAPEYQDPHKKLPAAGGGAGAGAGAGAGSSRTAQ